MNGKQITPFCSEAIGIVSHRFSLVLFKIACKICRCFCFCLGKPTAVCMQTFRHATPHLEIPKEILVWNPSIKKAKAEACNSSRKCSPAAGEPCYHVCVICRTRLATPAAGQCSKAGDRGPWVSHCALAARPLWDLGNHCSSLPQLPHQRIKKVTLLISCESSFLLLIM